MTLWGWVGRGKKIIYGVGNGYERGNRIWRWVGQKK